MSETDFFKDINVSDCHLSESFIPYVNVSLKVNIENVVAYKRVYGIEKLYSALGQFLYNEIGLKD